MEITKETFRDEVARFRSTFKEGAIDSAEKSLTWEKRGNVGIIIFDQYQEKANKLSSPNMLRLFDLFSQAEKDKDIGCLVIISRKPTIFIAGADIAEISKFGTGEAGVDALMKLQSVFTYLEKLSIPSIAAINGACMGGGTELTLACDYRMITDAPETRIGLPEVLLGIFPGWGGTQRLPRLLGLEKSLDLILTGKTIDGRKAKKIGLADKLVPKEFLEDKAIAWAQELAKTRGKRNASVREFRDRIVETVPGGKWLIFDQAKKKILEKTKGNYPAPLAALEVVRQTYGGDLEKGLHVEAEAFSKLVGTQQSKNLISVFYLQEKVKKDKGVETTAIPQEIKRAAVLGAGVMGGGIAQLFAAKGVRVRMKDINWDAVGKGMQHAYKIFKKQVDRKKMKSNELDNAMARIEGSVTFDGFKHLDLVVEAVVEDLEIKKKVFQELETKVEKKTILATNTSSLSVSQIAEATKDATRVVGLHFFNPVDKMPLVEVVRGQKSSDEAVSTVFLFAKKLGKTPIVVKDSPGFVVNRILGPYMNEAVHLMVAGVKPVRLDAVMEKFGMPMGPCALLDEVGLDVATKVSKVLYGAFGDRMKPPEMMASVAGEGRLGKKTGKGLYLYENGGKKRVEDTAFLGKIGFKDTGDKVSDSEIEKRLVYLMVNEAARILEENLVREPSDIDVGMIFGTGFAPFRGGLLRYADSVGAESIVSDLEIFVRDLGQRFQPSGFLQQLAVSGKKFYRE